MAQFGNVSATPTASMRFNTVDLGAAAPTTSATSTILGGQFGNAAATLGRSYKTVLPGIDSGAFRGQQASEQGRARGAPAASAMGISLPLLTAHTEPNQDVVSNGLPVTHLGSTIEQTNSTVMSPFRTVTAARAQEIAGVRHLLVLKSVRTPTTKQVSLEREFQNVFPPSTHWSADYINPALALAARGPMAVNADMQTKVGVHFYSWNMFIDKKMYALFTTDIVAYAKMTPRDLIFGNDKYEWTKWFVDGVVLLEAIPGGESSQFSDGFTSMPMRNSLMRGAMPPQTDSKNLSVVAYGKSKIVDYWDGRGITPGATLWMVITQKAVPYGKNSTTYSLGTKSGPYSADHAGGFLQETVSYADLETSQKMTNKKNSAEAQEYYKALQAPYRPWGAFPLTVPDGGSPFVAFREREDEWGHAHSDALFIKVGTVLHEPYRYTFHPAIVDPSDAAFQRLTNGVETSLRQPLEGVLVAAGKDGWLDTI